MKLDDLRARLRTQEQLGPRKRRLDGPRYCIACPAPIVLLYDSLFCEACRDKYRGKRETCLRCGAMFRLETQWLVCEPCRLTPVAL
jgi:hypothetical protein